jgi:ATP-binding cassette, subfamily B, bacterial MsbA
MKKFFGILRYVKGYWRYGALNILFNILSVVFSVFSIAMVFPFLQVLFQPKNPEKLQEMIDRKPAVFHFSTSGILDQLNYFLASQTKAHGSVHVLMMICVFLVITIFLKNLFRYLGMFYIGYIREGVVKDLRNRIFKKTLELPLSYYSEERKGDIMSRMTADVQEINWSIMQSLEMIFREPITFLIYMISMLAIFPKITLLAFVCLSITALLIGRIGKSLRKNSKDSKEKMGFLLSLMEEALGGLRIVKGFNAEKQASDKFGKVNEELTRVNVGVGRRKDLASPLSEFLGFSVFTIILYFGGKSVLDSATLDGALFITYLLMFTQLLPPAKSFTEAYYAIQKGLASAERLDEILDAPVTISDKDDAQPVSSFEKEIEYRDVSFAYREGEIGWVLENINLKIQKGKAIALVGQSGSGKTTLVDMLPRFYDTTKGNILIDGLPIRDAKLKDLRSLMGIVTQESILFNDTVYNNIAFGIENATEGKVIEAAKIANAHDFIMQMPHGYNTNIGDRGSNMSGGQRQRISIARAVLKNPPILILDEATSALDTESERLVQDALNNLMKNRTSVIIAHRLSTIQHADEIIVMHKGAIIERGGHAELLAKGGSYKKLHDLQSFV